MGNCSNELMDRRSAHRSLIKTNSNSPKSPLYSQPPHRTFCIRTWPTLRCVNLTESQNCIERSLQATLQQGQKMEIVLKSQIPPGLFQPSHCFNLNCQVYNSCKGHIINFPREKERKQVWRFIRDWTKFDEQDVMRMGITRYRMVKLVNKRDQACSTSSTAQIPPDGQNSSHCCRICLSSGQSPSDPLISPCKCTGSISHAHLQCLSKWLFSINPSDQARINVNPNKAKCELCLADITDTPEYKKMTEQLLGNLQNVDAPYAVFQYLGKQEGQYFVLGFSKKTVYSVGRSTNADLCDRNDKCVSKINSQIAYRNGIVMVRDCDSLHGTMMNVRGQLTLGETNRTENVVYHNMLITATQYCINLKINDLYLISSSIT